MTDIKRSISGVFGKGSIRHNNREFQTDNVDKERVKDNITLCRDNIKDVYYELFNPSLEEYNNKQKRKDRRIPNYYEHIRHSKQEKEFYEVIFQIGNKDDTSVDSDIGKISADILQIFYEEFQNNNPNIRIFNSVIHMDEATPHLHIDFVPFTTNSKRGLSTRNSLTKALEQQGFIGEGKFNTATKLWVENEKQRLSDCMKEYNIEHENKQTNKEHLSVLDFKKQERVKEIKELDNEINSYLDKKEKVKDIDTIKTSSTFMGKVSMSKEDFESVSSTAKMYHARDSKEVELQNQVNNLQQTVSKQNAELSKNRSLQSKINSAKKEQEVSSLRALLDMIMEFIELMGLKEKLKQFLKEQKNKDIQR